jgi:hypothetical protein
LRSFFVGFGSALLVDTVFASCDSVVVFASPSLCRSRCFESEKRTEHVHNRKKSTRKQKLVERTNVRCSDGRRCLCLRAAFLESTENARKLVVVVDAGRQAFGHVLDLDRTVKLWLISLGLDRRRSGSRIIIDFLLLDGNLLLFVL